MKNNKRRKLKFYNRLYFRIYLYFGIVIVIFAILLGVIYTELYEKSTMSTYIQQATEQAKSIAAEMTELVTQNDVEGSNAYMEFLEVTENGSTTDVWIISRKKSLMKKEYTNAILKDIPMSKELKKAIEKVWEGQTTHYLGYDEIYEMDILKVATPIYCNSGEIMGLVLLNSFVESRQKVLDISRHLIFYSTLAALTISFLIAIIFARNLSKPISTMQLTALQLAQGNYKAKTKVKYSNEIGSLAKSIDILADRLQKNEQERENMEQMRMDFFSNVSHELRTPITVVRGYTETLLDDVVTDERKKKQYYERLLSECNSMERLVGDLLTLSKMQNPDFVIHIEPVDIIEVWDNLLRNAKKMGEAKHLSFSFDAPDSPCIILGDYDRLKQMFMVIIDNAIKFSDENSKIEIIIERKERLYIKIKDYGCGIKEEELPFIFEKFYKSKLRQNEKGSGLGLMIAKQIVMRHEGDIHVESKEGEGSEFTFSFAHCNNGNEFEM